VVQATVDGRPARPGPEHVRAVVAHIARARLPELARRPFEVVVDGTTPADDRAAAAVLVRPYAEAGATWWIDADWEAADLASLERRILAGPPRL
jgi:hypothetical protein